MFRKRRTQSSLNQPPRHNYSFFVQRWQDGNLEVRGLECNWISFVQFNSVSNAYREGNYQCWADIVGRFRKKWSSILTKLTLSLSEMLPGQNKWPNFFGNPFQLFVANIQSLWFDIKFAFHRLRFGRREIAEFWETKVSYLGHSGIMLINTACIHIQSSSVGLKEEYRKKSLLSLFRWENGTFFSFFVWNVYAFYFCTMFVVLSRIVTILYSVHIVVTGVCVMHTHIQPKTLIQHVIK